MAEDTARAQPQPAPAREKIRPFASLEHRNFRLLWLSAPFNGTGLFMRNTANAWQVYHLTGSTTLLGLTFLFQGLPAMIIGLFGGTLADILDRRRLLLLTMSAELCLALLLGTLTLTGAIEVWHIYAITFTSATVSSIANPARSSLLPKLVPRHLLLNATALQATTGQIAMLLGPVLAGVVISATSAGPTYFINAGLLLPGIAAVSWLRVPPDLERRKIKLNVAAIFEGLTFAIRTRVLMAFLLLDTVTMVLGYYPSMMPVFAEILEAGPVGLGMLLSAPAFGSLLGLGAILFLGHVQRKGYLIIAATILHAVVLIGFAVSPWFALSLGLVAVLGLLDAMSVSVRSTSFQLLAPDAVRGRVMSLVTIFAIGSNSMGGAYLGLSSALLGPRMAMGLGGALGGVFAIGVALFWKRAREFRTEER